MFDIGFGEMMVCALLALVVLGPERLPKLARWVGRFTGQARAYMQGLSAELERESHLADLKRQLADTERLAREHADEINRSVMSGAPALASPAPVMTALPAPVETALPPEPVPALEPSLAPAPVVEAPALAADAVPGAPDTTATPLASLPPATGVALPPAHGPAPGAPAPASSGPSGETA